MPSSILQTNQIHNQATLNNNSWAKGINQDKQQLHRLIIIKASGKKKPAQLMWRTSKDLPRQQATPSPKQQQL